MKRIENKIVRRARRKRGIRKNLLGVSGRPRLSVFRSAKHIYAQLIDDLSGRTLAAASTVDKDFSGERGSNRNAAESVGARLAERAKAVGVAEVIFDRNGFRYHGRVKALADAARKGGLKF